MSDPRCKHCGRIRAEHYFSDYDYCMKPSTAVANRKFFEPASEAKGGEDNEDEDEDDVDRFWSAWKALSPGERDILRAELGFDDSHGKYYQKARVYGAVACHYREALKKLAPSSGVAREALAWRDSLRNGVPQSELDAFAQLMGLESALSVANARATAAENAYTNVTGALRAIRAQQEAEICRLRPVVEAARDLRRLLMVTDQQVDTSVAVHRICMTVRALDASPPDGVTDSTPKPASHAVAATCGAHPIAGHGGEETGAIPPDGDPEWLSWPCRSCGKTGREGNHATDLGEGHDYDPVKPQATAESGDRMRDERDHYREKYFELQTDRDEWKRRAIAAEEALRKKELASAEEVRRGYRFKELCEKLRAEAADVARRTAEAQREACADRAKKIMTDPHCPGRNWINYIADTPLVTNAAGKPAALDSGYCGRCGNMKTECHCIVPPGGRDYLHDWLGMTCGLLGVRCGDADWLAAEIASWPRHDAWSFMASLAASSVLPTDEEDERIVGAAVAKATAGMKVTRMVPASELEAARNEADAWKTQTSPDATVQKPDPMFQAHLEMYGEDSEPRVSRFDRLDAIRDLTLELTVGECPCADCMGGGCPQCDGNGADLESLKTIRAAVAKSLRIVLTARGKTIGAIAKALEDGSWPK